MLLADSPRFSTDSAVHFTAQFLQGQTLTECNLLKGKKYILFFTDAHIKLPLHVLKQFHILQLKAG